ncbi:caspase domain-containing protein [Pilobolus umbonatus]|nr:caspase domain-containing protein [Pilobolus umbonatus]
MNPSLPWKHSNHNINTFLSEPNTPLSRSEKKRSRITRACDVCRRKKIKCSNDGSMKCHTCEQYELECTFNDTIRKRGPPKGYIESLELRLKNMEKLLEKVCPDTSDEPNAKKPRIEKDTRKNNTNKPGTVNKNHRIVRYLGSSSGYYLVGDVAAQHAMSNQDTSAPAESAIRFHRINHDDNDIIYTRNITSDEHKAQVEPIEYNDEESIAPKEVIDELVKRFFELQHVSLPLIDKCSFMEEYTSTSHPAPTTILIYTLCSHACLMIPKDDDLFSNHGINRNELFNTLVTHTSELIQDECLTPRISTIQALLLLCAHPPCSKSYFKTWLRAGMAVRMAQEIGLHRTFEKLPLSEKLAEKQKRLWYCVYITDRWCCAVMGRPMAISDIDCDIEFPDIHGGTNGTEDYSLFIHFIKLSGLLGEVLRRIYTPKLQSVWYPHVSFLPIIHSISRMLLEWYNQLPCKYQLTKEEIKSYYITNTFNKKLSEAGPLMLCYHVMYILLYRIHLVTTKDLDPELIDEATHHCMDSAKTIIDIARLLKPAEIMRFGWNFAGYAIFQATLIHVYNCTNTNTDIANESRMYVNICIKDCIQPMATELPTDINRAIPLIHALMTLIGADTHSTESPSLDHKNHSPMSVHAILSDWDSTTHAQTSVDGEQNVMTAAAWQYLFSSAATPFMENATDWRYTLNSLAENMEDKMSNYGYSDEGDNDSSYKYTKSTYTSTTYSHGYSSHGDEYREGGGLVALDGEDEYDELDEDKFCLVSDPTVEDDDDYEVSNCQGKKKALLIGINYFGTANVLSGCINDVQNIKKFLINSYDFQEEDMVILTDDQDDKRFSPTRANIMAAMSWLTEDAHPDDSYFFHFSGHGGSLHDEHSDEDDMYDETIYPVDFTSFPGQTGQIKDDEMHKLLVKPLPKGCRLTCVFDSCHSGTALDLPYIYSTKGVLKERNLFKHAGKGIFSAGLAYAKGDADGALSSLLSLGKELFSSRKIAEDSRRKNESHADVIMLSGCKDDQTSADAHEAGKATGAMSYALIRALHDKPEQTYHELLNNLRNILREKYEQKPQLSCSHPIDIHSIFRC